MASASPESQNIETTNPLTEVDVDEPPAAVEEVVKNGVVRSEDDIKWLEVKQLLGNFSSQSVVYVYFFISFIKKHLIKKVRLKDCWLK